MDALRTVAKWLNEEVGPVPRNEIAELCAVLQNAPRAFSAEADFDLMTWTFEIDQNCRVAAGTYALVWMPPNLNSTTPPDA